MPSPKQPAFSTRAFARHVGNKLGNIFTTSKRTHRFAPPFHPIHALPPELIAYILVLLCLEDNNIPIIALAVCRKWRFVALYTPALWRRITLNPRSDTRYWDGRLRMSGEVGLDIELTFTHPNTQILRPDVIRRQMSIILPYIYRWRSLSISLNVPNLWYIAFERLSAPASLLESLTLIGSGYPPNPDWSLAPRTLFLGSLPRLSSMKLTNIPSSSLTTRNPTILTGTSLTSLSYTPPPTILGSTLIIQLIDLLQISPPLLRDLRIFFTKTEGGRPPYHRIYEPQVTLPHLLTLTLSSPPSTSTSSTHVPIELWTLLTLIHLPSLTHLKLLTAPTNPNHPHQPKPFKSLPRFWNSVSLKLPVTLRRISLERGWYDGNSLVQGLFRGLKGLVRLKVRMYDSDVNGGTGRRDKGWVVYRR